MGRRDATMAAVLVAALGARCSVALGWDRPEAARDARDALASRDATDGHTDDAPQDAPGLDTAARPDTAPPDVAGREDVPACRDDEDCRAGTSRRCCAGACRECRDSTDCPGGRRAAGAVAALARAYDVGAACHVVAGALVGMMLALRAAGVVVRWRADRAAAPRPALALPYRGAPPARCRRHVPRFW